MNMLIINLKSKIVIQVEKSKLATVLEAEPLADPFITDNNSILYTNRASKPPSTSQPSLYTSSQEPTPHIQPSSLPLHPARPIGAGIQNRVQMVRNFTSQRLQKSAHLSTIMLIIKGKCPICFVRSGQLHEHSPWVSCERSGDIPNLWLKLKRSFKFEKYAYCYSCALPQDRSWNREAPECHRSFKFGQGIFCPWANFIYIALWTLWHDIDKRAFVITKFSLPPDISYDDFEAWIGTEEQMAGEYFKGLEVFLLFCEDWLSHNRRRV